MPTITMRASQAGAFLRAQIPALVQAVVEAETKTLEQAETELILASSGTHSASDLRRAGHPYARRAPNAAYDPAIINKGKTGAFQTGWHKQPIIVRRDGKNIVIVARIINTDPKARFMKGTQKMVARPIVKRVYGKVGGARQSRLNAARLVAMRKANNQ